MADTSTWQNSTFAGNQTAPPNSTILWPPIPLDARRDLQVDIVACAVITYVIALIFVLLRFYTRGWINHVLGPSDWCILPALVRTCHFPYRCGRLTLLTAICGWGNGRCSRP